MFQRKKIGGWHLKIGLARFFSYTAIKPFGTIDTPIQNGVASGAEYTNFGWVLTPLPKTIPVDGTTIGVCRGDIAALFPGYRLFGGREPFGPFTRGIVIQQRSKYLLLPRQHRLFRTILADLCRRRRNRKCPEEKWADHNFAEIIIIEKITSSLS